MQRSTSKVRVSAFRKEVLNYWKAHGRHALPWRKTTDAYKILVSEIMLQQTQVARTIPKYAEFLKKFPTVSALGRAKLSDVLSVWSGMGYNRRAKFLRDAAAAVVEKYDARIPRDYQMLRGLPGIGDYTARAIRTFAFNKEGEHVIETNIRAALIHYFFPRGSTVSDAQLIPIAQELVKGQKSRTWNTALMDYGAHIKALHGNPSRRSAGHVKQSRFKGSVRESRGAIMRAVGKGVSLSALKEKCKDHAHFETALAGLHKDGLLIEKRGRIVVA
jgi:A/G-specific adenine glycosylase